MFTVRNEVAKVMFLQVSVILLMGGCLVLVGGAWSWGVPGPRGCLVLGGGIPACTPPGDAATAADGMHPTGMHSCLICVILVQYNSQVSVIN